MTSHIIFMASGTLLIGTSDILLKCTNSIPLMD